MTAAPGDLRRADSPLVSQCQPSPNHDERAGVGVPDAIVLHYTGMADGLSALAQLCKPVAKVSSHYLVEEDGATLQLVAEARRAWHAGRALWHGASDLNSVSIGIEIVNGGHDFGLPAYPDAQIAAVAALCRDIAERRHILPERILAHSDIAPGRKQDPGESFPWGKLHAAGVGLWVPERTGDGDTLDLGASGAAVTALQSDLAEVGYGLDPSALYDPRTRSVVEAFQRHFRPSRVDGIADRGTRATLTDLIAERRRLIGGRAPPRADA